MTFGEMHALHSNFTNLSDRAGHRGKFAFVDDLDRINDEQIGLELIDVGFDIGEESFGEQKEIRRGYTEPFGAQGCLLC